MTNGIYSVDSREFKSQQRRPEEGGQSPSGVGVGWSAERYHVKHGSQKMNSNSGIAMRRLHCDEREGYLLSCRGSKPNEQLRTALENYFKLGQQFSLLESPFDRQHVE